MSPLRKTLGVLKNKTYIVKFEQEIQNTKFKSFQIMTGRDTTARIESIEKLSFPLSTKILDCELIYNSPESVFSSFSFSEINALDKKLILDMFPFGGVGVMPDIWELV